MSASRDALERLLNDMENSRSRKASEATATPEPSSTK